MYAVGLDLGSLARRGRGDPHGPEPGVRARREVPDALAQTPSLLAEPTRRDVLKVAGIAAIGATPVVRAAARISLARPLTVATTPGRVQVRSGSVVLLDLRAASFSGRPSLTSAVRDDGRTEVRLRGARYPGTGLPADFRLLIDTSPGGLARLEVALGGLAFAVPAAAWLSGRTQAVSRACFDSLAFRAGGGQVRLHGPATVTLAPGMSLAVHGRGVASAEVHGGRVVSDDVAIRLASADEPSLFSRRVARRTIVTLERGARRWDLSPEALETPHGSLSFGRGAITALTFETAETLGGRPYRVAVAEAPEGATLVMGPASGFTGQVPLRDVRVARAYDAAGDGIAVTGEGPGRVWLRAEGASYCVGADGAGAGFTAVGRGSADRFSWAPRVFAVSAPLQGALASPITFPESSPAVLRIGTERLGRDVGSQAIIIGPPPVIELPPAAAVEVVRPRDMMSLHFGFYNMSYSGTTKKIFRTNTNLPARIAVRFPPQSVLEQAFPLVNPTLSGPPVRSLISGPSQLLFRLPTAAADAGVPLTLDALLDWRGWSSDVTDVAKRVPPVGPLPAPSDPRSETDPTTYIEAPYRLFLSPNEDSWWKLSGTPAASTTWVPLWHARLHERRTGFPVLQTPGANAQAIGVDPPPIVEPPIPQPTYEVLPSVRAIWSPDYPTAPETFAPQFPTVPGAEQSLKAIDRRDIVKLTAELRDNAVKTPLLMMTALGAWLTAEGNWRNTQVSLVEWKHRMTLGRDHFVRIVRDGYLYPFGHRAVYIEVTERMFATSPVTHRKTAYLFKRRFIIVLERDKSYSLGGYRDRMSPFRTIRVLTKQTPNLDQPLQYVMGVTMPGPIQNFPSVPATQTFVPKVNGGDFLFEAQAVDWQGNESSFVVPLAWVDRVTDTSWTKLNSIQMFFKGLGKKTDLRGQKVSFAAAASDKPEATRFETRGFYFGSYVPASGGAEWTAVADFKPHFWPRLERASVRLADASKLSGNEATTDVKFWETYVANGFGTGEVFLETITPMALPLTGQSSGAMMTPSMSVRGISRKRGAVSGELATFDSGTFDPVKFFGPGTSGASAQEGALDAKLFGSFALSQILKAVNSLGTDTDPNTPRISTKEVGTEVIVAMDWKYIWAQTETLVSVFQARGGSTTLSLHSEVRTPRPGYTGETKSSVKGELTDFKLGLLDASAPWIAINFNKITFTAESGKGTDVDPDIAGIEFGQALAFLAELQKYMGFASALAAPPANGGASAQGLVSAAEGGAGGGLSIDVSSSGITAALSIAIPSIAVGPFSLSNIVIGAKLTIPFTGAKVLVGFNVSSKEKPFQLAVCGFGGQGYFEMTLSADGMESLTISFEFGIIMALNFGVASGSVSITGGFTYMMTSTESGDTGVSFKAFIKMSGELSILGIIELCITFTLTLEYQNKALTGRETLVGQCEVSVSVKLLFFKVSTSFTVERELSGSDPPFRELMPSDKTGPEGQPLSTLWDSYCDAFAPITVGG